jgi:hypothetical protein
VKTSTLISLLAFSSLLTPPLAGQATPAPVEEREPAYVRRFSLGGRLSFPVLRSLPERELIRNEPVGPAEIKSTLEAKSRLAGGGVALQIALTERLALSLDLFRRKIGYRNYTETRTGTDKPETTWDERTLSSSAEQTRANVWEFPVLGRYYTKDRHNYGPRGFFEGGLSIRRAGGVITFTQSGGECCIQIPAALAHRYVTGVVGGAGLQVMDDFGVKVIPEVRYTRWFSRNFDTPPAQTARHQLEILLGITF